ncbi:MAG: hypothetical protein ACLP05_07255 [Candidatus Kryptoniota bacterium]
MTEDDFVGVPLDTYGTMQDGYEFFVNPRAIQLHPIRTGSKNTLSYEIV